MLGLLPTASSPASGCLGVSIVMTASAHPFDTCSLEPGAQALAVQGYDKVVEFYHEKSNTWRFADWHPEGAYPDVHAFAAHCVLESA